VELRGRSFGARGAGAVGGGLALFGPLQCRLDDPGSPFLLIATVGSHQSSLAFLSLELERRDSASPAVTSQTIRDLPLAGYLALARAELLATGRNLGTVKEVYAEQGARDGANADGPWTHYRITPAKLSDLERARSLAPFRAAKAELLPKVASEYQAIMSDEAQAPLRRRATQEIANRLGYTRGHVSRLLSEARHAGMLPALPADSSRAPARMQRDSANAANDNEVKP